jgi:hypothetical protein
LRDQDVKNPKTKKEHRPCLIHGTFQTFLCLFVIKKVGQQKIFSNKIKTWLVF